MDSKVNAATWAMARGVSVVICNGMQEKAIKTIISGRKVGTFFTDYATNASNSVDEMAESGKTEVFPRDYCLRFYQKGIPRYR